MSDNDKHREVDRLLRSLFNENASVRAFQLKELFDQRLEELSITKHQACKILGVENKTLDSLLIGDSKKVDFLTIIKLSYFLDIPHNSLFEKYFELVYDNNNVAIEAAKKRSFLVNNFDLPALKRLGLISSINDFSSIEKSIKSFFGYDTIFEYGRNKVSAALSSGKRKTSKQSLDFWFETVCISIDKTPNPNIYNRDSLIEFFPKIRAHSMNIEKGFLIVAQMLFKMGVTLIIVPKFHKDLHIRGATFSRQGKPCIALTKYTQFYPTLWFALIHELFHVLYDWEVIKKEIYHFSVESKEGEEKGVTEIIDEHIIDEDEANDFAREYLFSKDKLEQVYPYIDEPLFVEKFAKENHVHPSFIYTFYLWEYGNNFSYAKYNKYLPRKEYDNLLENFKVNDYLNFKPVNVISKERNRELNYNTF
ncbi:ImmA/IrrE family metallo-endopeptidase [Flagellimonas oceanensis]|uniref:ImmA/IrrE family metallo-endopeptidase n=1 Tax=Flagellimonas oceanensis TaxID=2499163 RepID=UPI003BAA17B8